MNIKNNTNLNPLVVTPEIRREESMQGFLLRTSEVNGYERPSILLKYAGLTEKHSRNVRLPNDKISRILNRDSNCLLSTAYTLNDIMKRANVMGKELPKVFVQSKKIKICPQCIVENGHIDVFWDLKYAIGCHKHKKTLITTCPGCSHSIVWNRRGMLICKCGYDLSATLGESIPDESILVLIKILNDKLYGKGLDKNKILSLGFPFHALDKLSLSTLLGLIKRFSDVYCQVYGVESDGEYKVIERAGKLLSDWPNGYYEYLALLGEKLKYEKMNVYSYRHQYITFYNSIFSSYWPRNELEFLREEFIKYGNDYWGKSVIDKRMLRNSIVNERKIVGLTGLAKRMSVHPSTAKRLIELGVVRVENEIKGKNKRYLFDLSFELPSRTCFYKSFSERRAAKYLDIPVSVLKELRIRGVYKIQNLGAKIKSYHEIDVINLKQNILSGVNQLKDGVAIKDGCVTLEYVMRMNFGGADRKADIIMAVMDKKLKIYGRIGDNVKDIILNKSEVIKFNRDNNSKITGGRLTQETAKMLKCDPSTIPWLVKYEYLKEIKLGNGRRITIDSIYNFLSQYVSCSSVAERIDCSTRKVLKIAINNNIPLLNALRSHNKSRQPFVEMKYLKVFGLEKQFGTKE